MRNLGRFPAGLIAGGVGFIILLLTGLAGIGWLPISLFGGLVIALVVGFGAGMLAGGNPKFAGRVAGAGALAGLTAGGLLLIGQIASGIIAANQPGVSDQLSQQISVALTQAAATQTANGGTSSTTTVNSAAITNAGFGIFGGCFGLIDLGIAAGLGAIGGAVAGRNNKPQMQQPYGMQAYGAPMQPPSPYGNPNVFPPNNSGYPPAQGQPYTPPPASGYGSSAQPQYGEQPNPPQTPPQE